MFGTLAQFKGAASVEKQWTSKCSIRFQVRLPSSKGFSNFYLWSKLEKNWTVPIFKVYFHRVGTSTFTSTYLINPNQVDAFDVKPGALSIMTAGSVQILESKFSTGKCLQCCEDPFRTGKSTFSKCKNGQCIKSSLFCDGYENCEDGSDEGGYDIDIAT